MYFVINLLIFHQVRWAQLLEEVYSEPWKISNMERFVKITKRFYPWTFFIKQSNLDFWQGSEHAYAQQMFTFCVTVEVSILTNTIRKLFHDGGPYHIETSPLTCSANQWTGFYMIRTSVMEELNEVQNLKAVILIYLIINRIC